jgi:metal-responsive CopG/Arc/MetJ family transcriptional regulator
MSNNQRKVKSNWTFPMEQIEQIEAIAEDRGHDSPSELVREWLAEKIEEHGGEQK